MDSLFALPHPEPAFTATIHPSTETDRFRGNERDRQIAGEVTLFRGQSDHPASHPFCLNRPSANHSHNLTRTETASPK